MLGSANDRTHPNARDWQLRRLWDDSKWDGWAFCPLDKTHYHIRIGYCKTDYTRAQTSCGRTHIRKPGKRLIRKPVAEWKRNKCRRSVRARQRCPCLVCKYESIPSVTRIPSVLD